LSRSRSFLFNFSKLPVWLGTLTKLGKGSVEDFDFWLMPRSDMKETILSDGNTLDKTGRRVGPQAAMMPTWTSTRFQRPVDVRRAKGGC